MKADGLSAEMYTRAVQSRAVPDIFQKGPAVQNAVERRRHERFLLAPMYSRIAVRFLDQDEFNYEGHCYDLSEGGIQFELDRPIDPGTPVAVQIDLPVDGTGMPAQPGFGRSIFVFANVVWTRDDEDEPGPVRMAAVFTRFAHQGDRDRLFSQFCSGRYARAA